MKYSVQVIWNMGKCSSTHIVRVCMIQQADSRAYMEMQRARKIGWNLFCWISGIVLRVWQVGWYHTGTRQRSTATEQNRELRSRCTQTPTVDFQPRWPCGTVEQWLSFPQWLQAFGEKIICSVIFSSPGTITPVFSTAHWSLFSLCFCHLSVWEYLFWNISESEVSATVHVSVVQRNSFLSS